MRRDLLQEIHIELWRSFRLFDRRCSLQTWVYRVAHNVAASHIVRSRRASDRLVDLDALETEPGFVDGEIQANQRLSVSRLLDRIHRLKPLDRQIILLYLEGEQAASIAEITGLSAANVATKIHRIREQSHEELWKSQEEESMRISTDEVSAMARRWERKNVRVYWVLVDLIALCVADAAARPA